jgi:hypothetical protein
MYEVQYPIAAATDRTPSLGSKKTFRRTRLKHCSAAVPIDRINS